MRLAVITTHPIQYYAPVFKLLAERNNIQLRVFYTLGNSADKYDAGFKQNINWDIPLLDGYDHVFLKNTSSKPGSDHFGGIVNPELIRQVEEYAPDALLVYGWAYKSHLNALRYFKGKKPIIFRGDSTLLDKQNIFKDALRFMLLRWVYRHIDYALYNGINNKAYFKKYGLKESRLVFAPHAIDNKRFAKPRHLEATALRDKLGLSNADILVLFAGKFEQKKDPLILLDAFARIKNSNIHLLFMGDGELKDELTMKASKIKNVHFLGFTNQSDMPVIYQSCDLFCLPSQGPGETWGLAVNEAMACEKALLVSDKVGCAADLVKSDYNGAIFESGNTEDLSNQLLKLLGSKAQLQQYGIHSAKLIADWNFTEIARSIETSAESAIRRYKKLSPSS